MQRHYFWTKCCQLILLTFLANVIPWQGHIRFPFLIKNQIGALLDFIMWRWYFGGRWNDKSMFSFSSVLHWIPTNKHFHNNSTFERCLNHPYGFFIQCGIIGFPIQMDYLLRVLNQWHKKIQSCSIWNNVESLKNYIKHHIQFLTYVESWNCIMLLFEPIFCVWKLKDVWIVLWQLACLLGISHSLGLTSAINIF